VSQDFGDLSRLDVTEFLADSKAFVALTGLPSVWIADATTDVYRTLDGIDAQLRNSGSDPLAGVVELANLSSMVGNLFGASLARRSGGAYTRNRPHAYPDLLPATRAAKATGVEIKVALETNRPKGHLPKEGVHILCRYVLADASGRFTRGTSTRGDTVWLWECRAGILTAADYDLSNTDGDSGKTAVVKNETLKRLERIFYVPALLPYAARNGPWGDRSSR